MKPSIAYFLLCTLFILSYRDSPADVETAAQVAAYWKGAAADPSIEKARTAVMAFFKTKGMKDKRFDDAYRTAEKYGLVLAAQQCGIADNPDMRKEYEWKWPNDDEALAVTVDRFRRALSRYPVDYVHAVGLKAVLFVKNLRWRTHAVGGGYDRKDGVVIVTTDNHVMPEFIESAFNHEFFHMMQVRYYKTGILSMEQWAPFIPPGLKYQAGGVLSFVKGKKNALVEHPSPGLVTGYAGADYMHDQTELFCYLMRPDLSARLAEWQKTDGYLLKKEEFIKNAVASISPDFTLKVFEGIRSEGAALEDRNAIQWKIEGGMLKITACNVHVSGMTGKQVYAFIQLYEGVPTQATPTSFKTLMPQSDHHQFDRIDFEVPMNDLRKKFGAGEKNLTIRFGVAIESGKLAEDTYREIAVKMKL